MADRVDAATRSRIMSRIRGTNTAPELALRKALHAQGIRYRIHSRTVPGRPDISHKGARVAVFVDGCFWHGCPRHYRLPKSRQAFWRAKLEYNRDLRLRVTTRLHAQGWAVVALWECDIQSSMSPIVRDLQRRLRVTSPKNRVSLK